jgi:hypothetical protein
MNKESIFQSSEVLSTHYDLENESENLKKVKEMVERYPLEDRVVRKIESYEPHLLFMYRNYVDVIPAFIKAVNFADSR